MLKDANEAAELDDSNAKAFLTIGEALVELGRVDQNGTSSIKKIDKGIHRLRKAYSLS